MEPGREMDALIAEKVMGWEKAVNSWGNGADIGWNLPSLLPHDPERRTWSRDPLPYSTDISAAWQVVEKTRVGVRPYGAGWIAESEDAGRMYGNSYQAIADTAPYAICLAALKAVGVDFKLE